MDKFLEAALAPKAKRKAPTEQSVRHGLVLDRTISSAAKRPRAEPDSEAAADTAAAKETATAKEKDTAQPTTTAAESSSTAPALPSFQDVMAGQGAPARRSKTRKLYHQGRKLEDEERYDEAHKLFMRAILACPCHDAVRRQFEEAGVPAESIDIDPIGQCSCRDFLAVAQTRRQRSGVLVAAEPKKEKGLSASSTIATGDIAFPISELDLTAVYQFATDAAPCTCGSGRIRCTLPDHLRVLEHVAMRAVLRGNIDLATRASQWYIDLAPHHGQGYLYLAKSVLLAEKALASRNAATQADARFVALCLFHHGRHLVRTYGDRDNNSSFSSLPMLEKCCRMYSRGDFLADLPLETAEAILQQLSLSDLLTCLRVSKRWAALLRRVRLCLPLIALPGARFHQKKPQRQPPLKGLHKLLRRMPGLQARHLRIFFHSDPGPPFGQFVEGAMRHFLSHMHGLELTSWWRDKDLDLMPRSAREPVWPRLTVSPTQPLLPNRCRKLVLRALEHTVGTNIMGIIQWASATLEHLELLGHYNGSVDDTDSFTLPKLRILRVDDGTWSYRPRLGLLPTLCKAAPALEQLSLERVSFDQLAGDDADDVRFSNSRPDSKMAVMLKTTLRNLHTIHVGQQCMLVNRGQWSTPPLTVFPPLPAGMRCIDITSTDPAVAKLILFGADVVHPDPKPPVPHLPELEAFRCLAKISKRMLQLLQPSLNGADGRLAHLELDAMSFDEDLDFVRGVGPYYEIRYPDRLRTVGLYGFDWSIYIPTPPGRVRGSQFVDWAVQFRNAECIAMYPAWQGNEDWANHSDIKDGELLMLLVERIARRAALEDPKDDDPKDRWSTMRLRTVYQGMLRGSMREVLDKWQEKTFGNKLIQFPRGHTQFRPPVFPWPDRE